MQEVTKFDITTVLGKRRDTVPHEDLSDPKWVQHLDDLAHHRPFQNFEYQTRRADGALLWIRIAGEPQFDSQGAFTGYHGTGLDITEEKQAMQRLEDANVALAARNEELAEAKATIEQIAYIDALTGPLNRRAFERDLEEALTHAPGRVGLVHIDLDRFKWVNDTLGHPAGDKVLRVASTRIAQVIGTHGLVYRFGGDEFTVLLRKPNSPDSASALAEAVVAAFRDPIRIGAQHAIVGASVGVAFSNRGDENASDLVLKADNALYDAKQNGRNTVRISTPALQARLDDERRLSFDLTKAIERKEIVPYFQPQVDTSTNKVIGAEALVRWQHPERGLIAPGAFLRSAIDMGKAEVIDCLILEESMHVVDRLCAAGLHLPSISVNVSEARLIDPNLCNDIKRLWRNRSCQLTLELLETVCFDEACAPFQFSDQLNRLRQMGVRFETDDFGSGRASITGLLHISPDGLKIDRSLIQKVEDSAKHRKVVQGILGIAKALNIDCIAEGVETQANIDTLVALGCTRFQGYAISHPLPEQEFQSFLAGEAVAGIVGSDDGQRSISPKRAAAGH